MTLSAFDPTHSALQANYMPIEQYNAVLQERDLLTEQLQSLSQERDLLIEQLQSLSQERDLLAAQKHDFEKKVAELEAIVNELKRRLGLNSKNSSKPPSSDGYAKPAPKSTKKSSGKKPGGQKGHQGSNMEIPHEPDVTFKHFPEKCNCCPHLSLCKAQSNFTCTESRYTVDVEIKTKVTEHQTLKPKDCLLGDAVQPAQFAFEYKG